MDQRIIYYFGFWFLTKIEYKIDQLTIAVLQVRNTKQEDFFVILLEHGFISIFL